MFVRNYPFVIDAFLVLCYCPAGKFVRLLIHIGLNHKQSFKRIVGSLVLQSGKIFNVPSDTHKALRSSIMDLNMKREFVNFLQFVNDFRTNNSNFLNVIDPLKTTVRSVYDTFGFTQEARAFTGHALALYNSDDYMKKLALEFLERIAVYIDSRIGSGSPYLYPAYGLGEMVLSLRDTYGSTYTLANGDAIIQYDDKRIIGVEINGHMSRTEQIICDPSYALEKTTHLGQVIRVICILSHAVPNTDSVDSWQIICPQNQLHRKHDIYITGLSDTHHVAPEGYVLATISTIVETDNPEAEVQPALDLLGPIEQKFVTISNVYEPLADSETSQIFISKSYDAASHFDTTSDDILNLYKKLTGKDLDLNKIDPGNID